MATNLGHIGTSSFGDTRKPPLRAKHSACADVGEGSLLFAGLQSNSNGNIILADSWGFAQVNNRAWRRYNFATTPTARYQHTVAYDMSGVISVLFGGFDGTNVLGDTYTWDGITLDWVLRSPALSPTARKNHACAYHANTGTGVPGVMVFGGEDSGGTILQAGYLYDFTVTQNWITNNGGSPPSARKWHTMTRSSNINAVTIFGGFDGTNTLNDVYTLASLTNTWTVRSPVTVPSARQQHAAADFAAGTGTKGIIMFGGDNGSGTLNAETWRFNRVATTYTWTNVSASPSPVARKNHVMWTDISGNCFLAGGTDGTHDLYDMWQWTGAAWLQRF